MKNINIQNEIERVKKGLIETKQDAETLIGYVDDGLSLIEGVRTMEDALAFDSIMEDFDEKIGRLKHIQLS